MTCGACKSLHATIARAVPEAWWLGAIEDRGVLTVARGRSPRKTEARGIAEAEAGRALSTDLWRSARAIGLPAFCFDEAQIPVVPSTTGEEMAPTTNGLFAWLDDWTSFIPSGVGDRAVAYRNWLRITWPRHLVERIPELRDDDWLFERAERAAAHYRTTFSVEGADPVRGSAPRVTTTPVLLNIVIHPIRERDECRGVLSSRFGALTCAAHPVGFNGIDRPIECQLGRASLCRVCSRTVVSLPNLVSDPTCDACQHLHRAARAVAPAPDAVPERLMPEAPQHVRSVVDRREERWSYGDFT